VEIWKDVKGFEGHYKVSNLGRVKSCERTVKYFNPKTNNMSSHTIKEKIKKPSAKDNGYLQVTLYVNNKGINKYIHRLVAEAFIENPQSKKTVNHKDFDINNNIVSNLEWSTYEEQEAHKKINGRSVKPNTRKVKVNYLNGNISKFESICDCAKGLGIHRDTVYNIMKNIRSKKAIELNIKSIEYIKE
jgi:hypothetical protein